MAVNLSVWIDFEQQVHQFLYDLNIHVELEAGALSLYNPVLSFVCPVIANDKDLGKAGIERIAWLDAGHFVRHCSRDLENVDASWAHHGVINFCPHQREAEAIIVILDQGLENFGF
jgi:hypothetical protein